jgi:DNA-binding protein YbaB
MPASSILGGYVAAFAMVSLPHSSATEGGPVPDVPTGASSSAAEDWIRSWSASMSDRAAAAQSLSDRVAGLSVSATDWERTITVTVNGSGAMTDLRLTQEAARLDMDQLAAEILRTMRRAQSSLAERVAAIAAETVGTDSETGRAVVSSFESRFPVGRDTDTGSTGPPPHDR